MKYEKYRVSKKQDSILCFSYNLTFICWKRKNICLCRKLQGQEFHRSGYQILGIRDSEMIDSSFGTPCIWDPVKSIPSHDKKTKLPYQPIHSKGLNFFIFFSVGTLTGCYEVFFSFVSVPSCILNL